MAMPLFRLTCSKCQVLHFLGIKTLHNFPECSRGLFFAFLGIKTLHNFPECSRGLFFASWGIKTLHNFPDCSRGLFCLSSERENRRCRSRPRLTGKEETVNLPSMCCKWVSNQWPTVVRSLAHYHVRPTCFSYKSCPFWLLCKMFKPAWQWDEHFNSVAKSKAHKQVLFTYLSLF